ncbi:hypothetical protein [Mesorhizobium onobrychidis]|uniref:Uncharacterized protein n=1 Tax=Mesorhizobium onobrychidis TaxID=2775404 RepID=A0ABY5QSJ3_9HYPH|nr:hypothetical protein [Mesorhizobium onobrychidis]UVC13998.1 hypothetical protein IHQ72_25410 [Mesorhizobium onobrychidis]
MPATSANPVYRGARAIGDTIARLESVKAEPTYLRVPISPIRANTGASGSTPGNSSSLAVKGSAHLPHLSRRREHGQVRMPLEDRNLVAIGNPDLASASLALVVGNDLKPAAVLDDGEVALRALESQTNRE